MKSVLRNYVIYNKQPHGWYFLFQRQIKKHYVWRDGGQYVVLRSLETTIEKTLIKIVDVEFEKIIILSFLW